ncbi:hypothetical protein CEXT_574701 [Caerostris extrusa]|uniref:Uncharacterized protein n=1 Tax=Caerostris extrusa TaxID=172846 RepID=A0AAV4U4P6_CAEEX|nr:hypothetical protein CEXT_574701 [Caerostris extrusa]
MGMCRHLRKNKHNFIKILQRSCILRQKWIMEIQITIQQNKTGIVCYPIRIFQRAKRQGNIPLVQASEFNSNNMEGCNIREVDNCGQERTDQDRRQPIKLGKFFFFFSRTPVGYRFLCSIFAPLPPLWEVQRGAAV